MDWKLGAFLSARNGGPAKLFVNFCLIALLFGTLLVDADPKVAQEFLRGTALYLSILYAAIFIAGRFGFPGFLIHFRPSFFQLVLVAFALVSSVHAISHIVDTEIPRLKTLFRGIYAVYLIVVTSPLCRRSGRVNLTVVTVLLFSSFLLNWMFIVGSVRTIPMALLLAFVWLDDPATPPKWNLSRIKSDPFLWLILLAVFALFVSNVYNRNHLNGVEGLARLASGVFLFLLVRRDPDSQVSSIVIRALLALAALHILLIVTSIFFLLQQDPGYSILVTKKSALAGVNVNDISGYLITLFPLILGALFARKETGLTRGIGLGFLFLGAFLLLLIVKSRAAWPIMFLSMLMFGYLVSRFNRLHSIFHRQSLRWIIPAAFLLIIVVTITFASKAREIAYLADFGTLEIRFDLWRVALRAIYESPIFGIGSENYVRLSSQRITDDQDLDSFGTLADFLRHSGAYLHCHNLFLQLWLDGGIFYLIAVAGLFLFGIYGAITGKKTREDFGLRIAAAISLIAILLQGFLNYHFMNIPTWLTTWLLLGIVARNGHTIEEGRMMPTVWLVGGCVLSVFLAIHLLVLSWRGDAIRFVRDALFKNAQDAYVLESEGKISAEMLRAAVVPAENAANLYSRNAELNQLAGEIRLLSFKKTTEKTDLTQARKHYDLCFESAPWSAFCAERLADILRLQKAPEQEYKPFLEKAAQLDPFDLLHQGMLRKL